MYINDTLDKEKRGIAETMQNRRKSVAKNELSLKGALFLFNFSLNSVDGWFD